MNKYDYPVPKKNLISRFRPAFEKLKNGESATILALPHTGRTSHLRFINSQKDFLEELGIDNDIFNTLFIDIDRIRPTYESFLSELLVNLAKDENNGTNLYSALKSSDDYLLSQKIFSRVNKITKKSPLIIVITLNTKAIPILSDIDLLMVQIQKASLEKTVSILWSVDTAVFRAFKPAHSSSSFLENVFYYPTFDKEETVHSVSRLTSLKGKRLTKNIRRSIMNLTGGISSTFHSFVNSNFSTDFSENPVVITAINEIKKELALSPNFESKLTTSDLLDFIKSFSFSESEFESVRLFQNPTAEDINLIKILKANAGKPVSRDDIAKALWGKAWQNKYSDWAIDKAVSRLRKKIKSPNIKIITVKNIGYQLEEFIQTP